MFNTRILPGLMFGAVLFFTDVGPMRAAQPDLDPAALQLLKAAVETIGGAKSLSFKARIGRDRLATNNQLITYFNDDVVTVSRPDKLRIDVDGEHHDVAFYFDAGEATLFDPETKFFVRTQGAPTIDAMLSKLESKGVSFPMSNLLETDPYAKLTEGLQTAYVIGRVNIAKKTFVHLVFTEAAADWQLWVEQGDKPLPKAVSIVYKSQMGSPRITMEFSDWNLDPQPDASLFHFDKPEGAHEIEFLPAKGGK